MEKEKNINKDLLEKNKKAAQTYAEANGYKNINEITTKANDLMNSNDPVQSRMGRAIAQKTVEELLALCLQQEIIDSPLPNYMNLAEKVFDGFIREGNSKEYVVDLPTGTTTYLEENFVPDEQTLQQVENYFIQIYDSKKQLNNKAYQFQKEQTLPVQEWLPYFKKNELNKFITLKQQSLNNAYKIYIYNKLCEIISDKTKGKVVEGQATNLFDAILEVAPEIDKMYQYNSEYNNEQTSKLCYAPNEEDILIFTSTKVRSKLINGIKTQLFNAELVGSSKKTFNYDNLKFLGSKIVQTDQKTVISDSKTEWIDDQTIIVLDISRIKNIIQLDESPVQFFAKNNTHYLTKLVWGAIDILPWCKKLVYKNANLLTMPNNK